MSATVWFERPRDAVSVVGPDAEAYLHGQVSQDVKALAADGTPAWTFVLEPTGKLGVLARIRRVEGGFLLDTDPGSGDALLARLRRFKIRVKADIDPVPVRFVAVRDAEHGFADPGSDLLVTTHDDDQAPAGAVPIDAVPIDAAAFERLRIESGWPKMGAELVDGTIPAETGVVTFAASFTKGCYTGQELVERMDSRQAAAPHVIRRLRAPAGVAVAVEAEVVVDGAVVGRVTSSAGDVALASMLRRAADAGTADVAGPDGLVTTVSVEAVDHA